MEFKNLPKTKHDPKLDPHTDNCRYRIDTQVADQFGLFAPFTHDCTCGYWNKLEKEKHERSQKLHN